MGQVSVEFYLLLALVLLLLVAVADNASKFLGAQKTASATMEEKVGQGIGGLIGYYENESYNTSSANGTDAGMVRLTWGAGSAYSVNESGVLQLTAWNDYPGVMNVSKLRIRIYDPAGMQLESAGGEADDISFPLAYSLTATFMPNATGNYTAIGEALDLAGQLYYNNETGGYSNTSMRFEVFDPASPPGPPNYTNPNFTLTATRSGEQLTYSSFAATPTTLYSVAGCQDGATICSSSIRTPMCSTGSCVNGQINGGWCQRVNGGPYVGCVAFIAYSGNCNMWGHQAGATARYISSNASSSFNLTITVTNSTGQSTAGTLTVPGQTVVLSEVKGNATLLGSPSGTSSYDPSSTSVLVAPYGTSNWVLRDRDKFEDYKFAESAYSTFASFNNGKSFNGMGGGEGDIIFQQCSNLNSKYNTLLSSTGASCSISGSDVYCPASSFGYPVVKVVLRSDFLGGGIPESNPEYVTSNNVTFMVYTN